MPEPESQKRVFRFGLYELDAQTGELRKDGFGYRGLPGKSLRLFPFLLPLDELWALAPFLLVERIGAGLALAVTAALLYVPFSQRSLLLMGEGNTKPAGKS